MLSITWADFVLKLGGFYLPRVAYWHVRLVMNITLSYLGWIMETIGESGVCEPWSPIESEPNTEEYPDDY